MMAMYVRGRRGEGERRGGVDLIIRSKMKRKRMSCLAELIYLSLLTVG
jgi:hypothetical protein